MRDKLKSVYHVIDRKIPALGNVIRRIHYRKLTNSIQQRIRGKENRITYGNSILSSVIFEINGNGNCVCIADGCVLNNVAFYITGDNHKIEIGAGCKFYSGGSLSFEDHNGSLVVGELTTFEYIHIAVTEPNSKVQIGQDCMFATDIDIRTGDSHSIIDSISGVRINYAKDVNIGNHVWVAAHCRILKGVSILEDSVIATGSVVVKGFEERGVVIAGNPAAIVKRNVTWSRKRVYETDAQEATPVRVI
jgi:acetyltransferase-like isoleucine patch superfamily enzyme